MSCFQSHLIFAFKSNCDVKLRFLSSWDFSLLNIAQNISEKCFNVNIWVRFSGQVKGPEIIRQIWNFLVRVKFLNEKVVQIEHLDVWLHGMRYFKKNECLSHTKWNHTFVERTLSSRKASWFSLFDLHSVSLPFGKVSLSVILIKLFHKKLLFGK